MLYFLAVLLILSPIDPNMISYITLEEKKNILLK